MQTKAHAECVIDFGVLFAQKPLNADEYRIWMIHFKCTSFAFFTNLMSSFASILWATEKKTVWIKGKCISSCTCFWQNVKMPSLKIGWKRNPFQAALVLLQWNAEENKNRAPSADSYVLHKYSSTAALSIHVDLTFTFFAHVYFSNEMKRISLECMQYATIGDWHQ